MKNENPTKSNAVAEPPETNGTEDTVIFDSETSADIPEFLMKTLPPGDKEIGDESSRTHLDDMEIITPEEFKKISGKIEEIEETEDEKDARKRAEKAEKKRRKRAEKAQNQKESKKKNAKRLLSGVKNSDSFFGGIERIVFGTLLLLLERGYYGVAGLLFVIMCGFWYIKIILGEGPIIQVIRETNKKKNFETFLLKISTTFKSR